MECLDPCARSKLHRKEMAGVLIARRHTELSRSSRAGVNKGSSAVCNKSAG